LHLGPDAPGEFDVYGGTNDDMSDFCTLSCFYYNESYGLDYSTSYLPPNVYKEYNYPQCELDHCRKVDGYFKEHLSVLVPI
jgi:hypothetical protein